MRTDPTAKTLAYYDANADAFARTTADVEFRQTQERFERLLAPARAFWTSDAARGATPGTSWMPAST